MSSDFNTVISSSLSSTRFNNAALHEQCSMSDMIHIKNAFTAANNNKMTAIEFRNLLRTKLKIEYDDDEYKLLFLKINTSRTGAINWEEVVTHLILGYFSKDAENQRESLHLPILGLSAVLRSQHYYPITRIRFCPEVAKDRSTDEMQGSYISVSRDGELNWWNLDMKLLRTARCSSPHLKVSTTWVSDMVCMPDVNIIVTSSTERDLRFYDCIANTFTLKIVITSWDYMICTMSYYFNKEDVDDCMLICGDVGGNVRVLQFSAHLRGPFGGNVAVKAMRHVDLRQRPNMFPKLRLRELVCLHPEWVRQVSYYESLHCVVSCANCPNALLMSYLHNSRPSTLFRVESGIQCFAIDEDARLLVTGGRDCVLRVWNPFVPSKPNSSFHGHQAGIISIVLQNGGQTIYSLSKDRTIKVWDVHTHACCQTYTDIPDILGKKMPISAVYNSATRQFILAGVKIAIIILDEQLNPLHTDGFTHTRTVSSVLYNPLFKVVVTCGTDSIIINWNLETGKRSVLIRNAHVRMLHCAEVPVEITAACFDPGLLLLLTGAFNGELKVWNFNTGECLRVMAIDQKCTVSRCFWVEGRILAVGWNRHVVEFEDTGMATTGKCWQTRHSDDVLAAAVHPPHTLATASLDSTLVLWSLQTGQPFRHYSCAEPNVQIKISEKRKPRESPSFPRAKRSGRARAFPSTILKPSTSAASSVDPAAAVQKASLRGSSPTTLGRTPHPQDSRQHGVMAMIFLCTRPLQARVASLFVALEDGQVQCWSEHPAGGLQGSFRAVHAARDYVASFATDEDNEFLFTGTVNGYVKVWLMSNFLINDQVHVNMPRLRLQFPFLWRDRIEGRAKRSTRDQPLPLLLSSYRAHMRCVTSIGYVDEHKLLFTGSSDYSVRVWRLSGEYLQTLGSFLPWSLEVTRFPPDVQKVASFTTFKVWRGGYVSRYVPGVQKEDSIRDISEDDLQHKVYGELPREPLLGQYCTLPRRPQPQNRIQLDTSLPTIPVYQNIRLASTEPVRRPSTPELLRQMWNCERPKKMHFDVNGRLPLKACRSIRRRCTQVGDSARLTSTTIADGLPRTSTGGKVTPKIT